MTVQGFAGWVLMYLGGAAGIGSLLAIGGKPEPKAGTGSAVILILGYILAAGNGGVPTPGGNSPAWPLFFIAMGAVAFLGIVWHVQQAIRRARAAKAYREARAGLDQAMEAMPDVVEGLAFDVVLTYRARGRRPERRRVSVKTIHLGRTPGKMPTVTAIDGYCHLRRMPRTFKTGQIVELADAETGEVIADPAMWLLEKAGGVA